MIKFMVMFTEPAEHDIEKFENAYNDFLALVERMPHIQRRQVVHALGSPMGQPRYYRILEIYFEDLTQLQASLMSERGQEAGRELARFDPNGLDVMYAEVYEEQGGSTPRPTPEPAASEPEDET